MKALLLALPVAFLSLQARAEGLPDPTFFTQEAVQRASPGAFALQPEAKAALHALDGITIHDADALTEAILADALLSREVRGFDRASLLQQTRTLKKVFDLQTRLSGRQAPELSLDENFARGAFFEFDPAKPGAGKVYINPKLLGADKNKFSALMLLVHETRHSEQFQAAFGPRNTPKPAYAVGFEAAFKAQKALEGKRTSYLDFMTLLNEYEAFRFGNYVVGRLTDFRVDTLEMGSYASQFKRGGVSNISLTDLIERFGYRRLVLEFHELEEDQYRRLRP